MSSPRDLSDRVRAGCVAAQSELEPAGPVGTALAALVERLTEPALRLAVAGPDPAEVAVLAAALRAAQPAGTPTIRVVAEQHGTPVAGELAALAECDVLVLVVAGPPVVDRHAVAAARELVAELGQSAASAVGVLIQPDQWDQPGIGPEGADRARRYARELRTSLVDVVPIAGPASGAVSGLAALRGVISERFVPVIDALRAASALRTVAALAWAPGTSAQQRATVTLRELGCALRGQPALRVLALGAALARLDPGELLLSDAARDDLTNLVRGGTPAQQVGLSPYAPAREVAAAADERIRRWRALDALHAPAAQRCVRLTREAFEAIYYATGPTLDRPTDRR